MPLPKGTQPEFVGGRRNKYFRGYDTSRNAAVPASVIKEDLYEIAVELHETAHAAAQKLYVGDREAFARLRQDVASLYANYTTWDSLIQDIDADRQEAVSNYAAFREARGLGEHKTPESVKSRYSVRFQNSDAEQAMAAIQDEFVEILKSKESQQRYVDQYAEALEKMRMGTPVKDAVNTSQDSEESDTYTDEDPNPQTREFPAVDIAATEVSPQQVRMSADEKFLLREPTPLLSFTKKDSQNTKQQHTNTTPPPRKPSYSRGDGTYNSRKEPGLLTSIENALGVGHLGSLFVTWRPRIGPFQINFGRKGFSSLGLHAGPISYRVYSRKDKSGLSSINLPGGISWRAKRETKGTSPRQMR